MSSFTKRQDETKKQKQKLIKFITVFILACFSIAVVVKENVKRVF